MTERAVHLQVLDFMKTYLASNDNMPSIEEIRAHFGWKSANAAVTHIEILTKHKYIEPLPKRRTKYRIKRLPTNEAPQA